MDIERGEALFKDGKIGEAIHLLEPALQHGEPDAKSSYILGVCYFRVKRYDDAEMMFKRVTGLESRHYLAYYYLGLIEERRDKVDDALVYFKIAYSINSSFANVRAKLEEFGLDISLSGKNSAALNASRSTNTNSSNDAGAMLLSGHRRMRSFSFWFLLGIATIPVYGLGILLLILIGIFAYATRYDIYEKRIDFAYGVLFRKRISVWLFQIEDIWLHRNIFNLLTNDASIYLKVSELEGRYKKETMAGKFHVSGLGNAKIIQRLWEGIRDRALCERLDKKKFLI